MTVAKDLAPKPQSICSGASSFPETKRVNPIVPLLTKPIVCASEQDLRGRTQIYARDLYFNEGREVTMVRIYDTEHEAEIRCLETNLRWVIPARSSRS